MGDKPERIFADDGETPYFYEPDEEVPPTAVEYVRADVAAAEVARLRAALDWVKRHPWSPPAEIAQRAHEALYGEGEDE